jgi:NADPH-dependent 2,4-dienoyl-CoA reductase/sulfur reductase-like enzyme
LVIDIVHRHILSKGLKLYLKDGVKAFHKKEKKVKVELQSGKLLTADMVILAIGVKPDVSMAKDAGLEIGERRGTKVNSYLQTSDPDIYAVGDAIEVKDFVNGGDTVIPLAGLANKQGRIAANNIYGAGEQYHGTQGASAVKVFDLTVAATGNSEKDS